MTSQQDDTKLDNQGFIVIHRQILAWEWYDDINTSRLFIHCLLKANYSDKKWRGSVVKRGSFITSVAHLSAETSLSVKRVRLALKKLKGTNDLAIKTTANYTMISITNYNSYQDYDKQKGKQKTNGGQTEGKRRANEGQQLNNENNNNNVNNENKEALLSFDNDATEAFDLYNNLARELSLPIAQIFTPPRKAALKKRLKDCDGLEGWKAALGKIKESSHCQGNNDRGWRADFDFMVQAKSFVKLMEGSYDDREPLKKKNSVMDAFDNLRDMQ